MSPGESSCPGGSECVAKGGRGCFRLSEGRPRLPFSPKRKHCKCGIKKNKHGYNFQNTASKTNQR